MKKRMEKSSKERGSSGVEEEPLKTAGLNTQDKLPILTIDKFQCCGNIEVEFPELCTLAGIREIPAVKQRTTESSSTEQANEGSQPQTFSKRSMTTWSSKPCLQIEIENEDHRSIKRVRISGWRVDEAMTQVLGKVLPSLPDLQSLEMWQAGLTDCILTTLMSTVSLCTNLRKVLLEGNPLPEQSYHVLIAENSMITHLSLRNNRIGEEGARLIGSALSTACSANKNLLSLNMAFNSIGDAGAIHIAQGLRFNRTLMHLSLASNHISDAGASCLAEVFGPFALTHEEIVERRRQLIKRNQQPVKEDSTCEQLPSIPSNSSLEHISKGTKSNTKKKDAPKKDEKLPASQKVATLGKKEDPKLVKKRQGSATFNTQRAIWTRFSWKRKHWEPQILLDI
ncbi:leucine-rich repeat-containing protein 71 isoform X2 [Trichomycterus rosablanca]|uniref:leucine-rich repeat-containing protein 71 isoform X2 n=1 Tax=Trichomycterus rosablanca TaxID=2290929 RepID=UPI002F360E1D